jgi:ubiquinone/menaquinone biosynthesis C-methylase UbiE
MVEIDPEGRELQTALKYISFKDKRVLEVGCGRGRLTFKYAGLSKHVTAIDPKNVDIEKAKDKIKSELSSKLEFHVGSGEHLLFDDESFDLVLFSHSLCCFADGIEAMKRGLNESWRVLKPEGILVNLQPSLHQPFRYNMGNIVYLINRNPKNLVDADGEKWIELTYGARFSIKNATLIEQKFNFVAEEAITLNEYYSTIEEVLDAYKEEIGEDLYGKISDKQMEEIRQMSEVMRTPKGILDQWNVVLSVLKKSPGPLE